MSFRQEVLHIIKDERDLTGEVTLSKSKQVEALEKLEAATRTYEEARKAALPYTLASYGIGVFGSARVSPTSRIARATTRFAQNVIEQNPNIPLLVITGGGPGIMEAANRGVHTALERNRRSETPLLVTSYGITIDLPHQEKKNKYVHEEDRHPEFSTRKQKMLDLMNGVLVMAGGYGTLYEALMVLQNKQTGHVEEGFLIAAHRFWEPTIDRLNDLLYHNFIARGKRPMISETDLALIKYVKNTDEAVDLFSENIQKWWTEFGRFIRWVS